MIIRRHSAVCVFCERPVRFEPTVGLWVDPLATGDDELWRETCDGNDSFPAEHRARVRARLGDAGM